MINVLFFSVAAGAAAGSGSAAAAAAAAAAAVSTSRPFSVIVCLFFCSVLLCTNVDAVGRLRSRLQKNWSISQPRKFGWSRRIMLCHARFVVKAQVQHGRGFIRKAETKINVLNVGGVFHLVTNKINFKVRIGYVGSSIVRIRSPAV